MPESTAGHPSVDDARAVLWRAMQERGITGPEMFALRYGRRLQDLSPAKALEIISTPAVRRVPRVPPDENRRTPVPPKGKE